MTSLRTVMNANMGERNLSTVGERVRLCWDGLNDHCITNASYSSRLISFPDNDLSVTSVTSLEALIRYIVPVSASSVFPRLNSWWRQALENEGPTRVSSAAKMEGSAGNTYTSILACSVRLLVRSSRNLRSAESVITAGNALEPPEPTGIRWRRVNLLFSRTHIPDGTEMDGFTMSAGSSEGVNFD